jgi:hypothetical protein
VQPSTLESIAEQPSLSIILEEDSESFGIDLSQWPTGVQGAAASVSDPASLPGSVSALAVAAADFAAPGRAATESASSQDNCGSSNDCDGSLSATPLEGVGSFSQAEPQPGGLGLQDGACSVDNARVARGAGMDHETPDSEGTGVLVRVDGAGSADMEMELQPGSGGFGLQDGHVDNALDHERLPDHGCTSRRQP